MKRSRIDLLARTGGSGWSSIPGDLLEVIAAHLSTDADHLHIHQVCAHWRACTYPPSAYRPWIVAGSRSRAPGGGPNYSVWLPRRLLQRRVEIGGVSAGLPHCHGASRGWLAPVDDARSPKRLVLWDPASGTEISLPCLDSVAQVFLSGDPLSSPDWMAVASRNHSKTSHMSFFWRPGDASWSALYKHSTAGIISFAFHGGRMYYMDLTRIVLAYELTLRPPALLGVKNATSMVNQLCRCRFSHPARGAYLVTCAGELLLIVQRRGAAGAGFPRSRWLPRQSGGSSGCSSFAEVYRVEWTQHGLKLGDRVRDLGVHSLFLGRLPAAELGVGVRSGF